MGHSSIKPNNGNLIGFAMSFVEKITVLDLIIDVLREHEKELDGLVERLEKAVGSGLPKLKGCRYCQ